MSVHEPSDGMAEEVERQLQLAVSAAALGARRLIASRQAMLAAAGAQSEARAQEVRRQLEQQRTMASSRVQPVFDDAWWATAKPRDIGDMWEQAEGWRDAEEPALEGSVFDRASARIQHETRERWGLDAGDVAALAYADNVAEHDRLIGDVAQPAADTSVAATAADVREPYDSPERRNRLQEQLAAADVPADAIDAQVLADIAQARPASEAAQPQPELSREPTRARARTAVRERHRSR